MELRITRWKVPDLPMEHDLRQIYRSEGLTPYTWSNGPGDKYSPHAHSYDKVIFVVRGTITWILPDLNQRFETHPGDRIDLPKATRHAAEVGPAGVTCLEAHLG
jgi:quercetin dioxygenase-like cupin family protein